MRMNKKGDLSLSINAIVILILAITMLGLGLAFMRNIFNQAGEQITAVSASVDKQMIDQMKAGSKTIDINQPRVQIKKGTSSQVVLGFKNVGDSDLKFQIVSVMASELGASTTTSCGNVTGSGQLQIQYLQTATTVSSGGDVRTVPFNLKATANAPAPFTCFYEIAVCQFNSTACTATDKKNTIELSVDVVA